MADFAWTLTAELDAWTLTNLQNYYQELEDGYNDLALYALDDLALNIWHLGDSLLSQLATSSPDPTIQIDTPFTSFTNQYKLWNDDTVTTRSATSANPGWAEVTDGTTALKVEWSGGLSLGMAGGDRTAGILVIAESNVRWMQFAETALSTWNQIYWSAFALQWKDSGGTWHTLEKTERFIDNYFLAQSNGFETIGEEEWWAICFPFTLRTLIKASDVSGDVYGVRLVYTNFGGDTSGAGGQSMNTILGETISNNLATTYLGEGSITALPIHAEDPA